MDAEQENIFAILMKNLISSSDAQGKARAAEELTKATVADHGFLSFYEYLNYTMSDEIEAIEVLSRIVLSRPRIYSDFRTYLVAMKDNFHELLSSIIKNDVVFGCLITKLFYSMRTHNLESDFDFFYADHGHTWFAFVFRNLCSREFYMDELNEVYMKNFKYILSSFDSHKNFGAIECGLQNLQTSFGFWMEVFSDGENQKLVDYFLSTNSKPSQCLIEALIFRSLFDSSFEVGDLINAVESFSSDFSASVSHKIDSGHKMNQQIIRVISQKVPSFAQLLPAQNTWIEGIIEDLKSSEPAVIAHGLYLLRKETESSKRKQLTGKLDEEVTNLCSQSLFHKDTYVFMNAVRLFQNLSSVIEIRSFSLQLLAKYQVAENPSSDFPRVVEVFCAWIERKAVSSAIIQKFIDICKPMFKSDDEECRISSVNALNIICTENPEIITDDYKSVFTQLNIQQFEPISASLETQALFSFIDTFLTALAKDPDNSSAVYGAIDDLCRRALKSPDSLVQSMALNNLMKLEHSRRF